MVDEAFSPGSFNYVVSVRRWRCSAHAPRNGGVGSFGRGVSNKAIARHLGISVHTTKFHVRALIDKLDAIGRTDAVAHAAGRGVIHL
jgi:hypothetical protein